MQNKLNNESEALTQIATLTQIACDLNIIKCLLITDFAKRNEIDVTEFVEDIQKVYWQDKEERGEDDGEND